MNLRGQSRVDRLELNNWAKAGTYMVLVLQFGRLDLLELLRQGRHDGQIDQQAVEKS